MYVCGTIAFYIELCALVAKVFPHTWFLPIIFKVPAVPIALPQSSAVSIRNPTPWKYCPSYW